MDDEEPLQDWTAWDNILQSLTDNQSPHARNLWSILRRLLRSILHCLAYGQSDDARDFRSAPTIASVFPNEQPEKINDHVYEIHRPATKAVLEIVFFHGFEVGDYKDSYWRDWLSADQTHCWLKTWLVQELPEARVLSVSYDSSLQKTSTTGRMDLYTVAENLESSLIGHAKVGQKGCPVIFVGHSLGGLVMKALCVRAENRFRRQHVDTDKKHLLASFLSNLKGMFFYATPHYGSIFDERIGKSLAAPLAQDLKVLDEHTARLNSDFSNLCNDREWTVLGVAESHETHLGNFHGVLVPEGSARWHMYDICHTIATDHFGICKPESQDSNSFTFVVNFVNGVMRKCERESCVDNLQDLPYYLVDLDTRVDKVHQLVQSNDRVAIIGMGGMGKITVAKKYFNNFCRKYEYTCFFDSVKDNVKNPCTPKDLQQRILDNLYCKGKKVTGIKWDMLKRTKTLFILDDVDSQDHVFDLKDFSKDTRLIVTSRNMGCLRDFFIHEIDDLDPKMSKDLFCRHAFRDDPQTRLEDPEFQNVLESVLQKCDGLPLILVVVGSSLYKAKDGVWRETLGKLERAESLNGSKEDKIWCKLRTSYDTLADDVEKKMFLDVAVLCKERGYSLTRVTVREMKLYWMATLKSAETGWQNLIERCLVREQLNYFSEPEPWMHELLRALGRREAFLFNDKPEKFSRICFNDLSPEWVSNNEDDLKFFMSSDHKGKCDASAVMLSGSVTDRAEFDVSVFSKFPNLRFLWLERISLRGDPVGFPSPLVVLRIVNCPYSREDPQPSLRKNLQLKNLVFLELKWQAPSRSPGPMIMSSILSDFGKMSKLRILRITFESWKHDCSTEVKKCIDQLGKLSALEELTLCNGLEGVDQMPESFANLTSLQKLRLQNCPQLVNLPSFAKLSSLQDLHMEDCPMLVELPSFGDGSSNPTSDRHCRALLNIHIENCPRLRNLPDSIGNLTRLQSLILRDCYKLESLPDTFGQLKQLQDFYSYGCTALKKLPDSFTKLCSLERAVFINSVRTLPKNMGELCALRDLKIEIGSCLYGKEEILLESSLELPALEQFELNSCCGLSRLSGKFGALLHLRMLCLVGRRVHSFRSDCMCDCQEDGSRSHTLPEGIEELTSLEELSIRNQDKVKILPPKLGQLRALKKLTIMGCSWLASLPTSFGELHALQELTVHHCDEKLRKLPNNFGQLHGLRCLSILNCKMLTRLPTNFGSLASLEELTLVNCVRLLRLPQSFMQLSSLEKLTVGHCPFVEPLKRSIQKIDSYNTFLINGSLSLKDYQLWEWVREATPFGSSVFTEHVHDDLFEASSGKATQDTELEANEEMESDAAMEFIREEMESDAAMEFIREKMESDLMVQWYTAFPPKTAQSGSSNFMSREAAPFGSSVFTEHVHDNLFEASSSKQRKIRK